MIDRVAKEIGEAMSADQLKELIVECGDGKVITEAQFIAVMKDQGMC